jgi:hypothetical protein
MESLPVVVVLVLHADGLLEYLLLLLFLQEGLVSPEQHVPVMMVLQLDLHDVYVLAEDDTI